MKEALLSHFKGEATESREGKNSQSPLPGQFPQAGSGFTLILKSRSVLILYSRGEDGLTRVTRPAQERAAAPARPVPSEGAYGLRRRGPRVRAPRLPGQEAAQQPRSCPGALGLVCVCGLGNWPLYPEAQLPAAVSPLRASALAGAPSHTHRAASSRSSRVQQGLPCPALRVHFESKTVFLIIKAIYVD